MTDSNSNEAGRVAGSFYAPGLAETELAELAAEQQPSLLGELALVRVVLKRLIEVLSEQGLPPEEARIFGGLIFDGARTVMRLTLSELVINGRGDELNASLAGALDELSALWNMEL